MSLSQADATARAEAEVRAYCGWHIAPEREDDTLTLDGPGGPLLVLPTLHVVSVASVAENGVDVDPEGYAWSAAGVIRRTSSTPTWNGSCGWTNELRGLTVTLTHGYTEMPLDVTAVIERMAARAVELSTSSQVLSQVGGVRYAVGVEGLRNEGLVSEADIFVLARYKLPPRP